MANLIYRTPYQETGEFENASYLKIGSSHGAGLALSNGVAVPIPLDDTAYSAYITSGTDISWDDGTPTVITINTDGVYDITAVTTISKGTSDAVVQIKIHVDGNEEPRDALFTRYVPSQTVAAVVFQTPTLHIPARPFTASQEIQFLAVQTGNNSNDTLLLFGGFAIVRIA